MEALDQCCDAVLGVNIHPFTEPTVVLPEEPMTLGVGS
jgi:hypothetical protein